VNLKNEKTKASKQLTSKLKEILAEDTEVEMLNGDPVIVTKAEKLARTMVRMALGYKEEVERKLDGNTVKDEIVHCPNAGMIALVYDRVEGRIPIAQVEDPGTRTLGERVSEQGQRRLNDLAKKANGAD
jgi:hypothetical protein